MQIGFIGLGQIGHPMATNLSKAGFALVVNDLARERADALVAAGATWADDARAVAEAADVVITSIPGPPEVKAVFEGERGLLAGIRAGATWIEMSTTDVDQLRAFAGRLEEKGAKTLDSPVTGGVDNAWLGKVTIFVGGEREEFERRRSVFEGIGDVVHYMGPLGSGMTTKLITNMLGFNHQVAMGEALMLGKRAGLDLVALRAAAQTSTGASAVIERDGPFVFDGTYDPTFTLDLACKDLSLQLALARDVDVPLEVLSVVEAMFQRARSRYGGDKGLLYTIKLIEDATGTDLRARAPLVALAEER